MDLDQVADELYALPLERFTAVRTEREKQARSGGDRELAASIHSLAKPTTVAWLANQLARRHADELGPLLELGAALREATATLRGEQLRTLTRQRHQVVHALIQQARALAAEAGHRVTDDTARGLEETLTAALSDADAARRLAAGRLTEGLQPAGFGAVQSAGGSTRSRGASPGAAGPAAGSGPAARSSADERRRRRAEQAWEEARRALDQAKDERALADRAVERTAAAAQEAQSELERLKRELDRAEHAARGAQRAAQDARAELDRAEQALSRAREAEREAQQQLAGLP